MTATGLPDSSVSEATDAGQQSSDETPEPSPIAVADTTDLDTRNRLRGALRILLAARRRDDGGAASIQDT